MILRPRAVVFEGLAATPTWRNFLVRDGSGVESHVEQHLRRREMTI